MNQLASSTGGNLTTRIAALANFIRAGRLTTDQANTLGRRPEERTLPIELTRHC